MIKYYRCVMVQQSPLRLSNGDSNETDNDLMTDLRGFPFIPGSSLAGALRGMLSKEDGDDLFGYISDNGRKESRVLVSDAKLPEDTKKEDIRISHRDGVGLNEYGVAKKSAKFDFEIVETAKPYTAIIEIRCEEGDREDLLLKNLLMRIAAEGIFFGARTTRGYGRMTAEVTCTCFELNSASSLTEWLDCYPLDPASLHDREIPIRNEADTGWDHSDMIIRAGLRMKDSFSVRVYATKAIEVKEKKKKANPDYSPMTNFNGEPVIPGTSWAGVFRHHMGRIARELGVDAQKQKELDRAFGVSGDEILKSRVLFSETNVEGGKEKIVQRNAVERFTAAPRNTGLYCAAIWYGGMGTLEIRIRDYQPEKDRLLVNLLTQCLRDLHEGLLNIGGEGGVGRGLAEITSLEINGKDYLELIQNDSVVIDVEGSK